uniref:adenylyl-sulfate kinase n=1 Tax=Cyclobacterium salsum TaxID=2666329 RepID=UPI003742D094
MRRTKIFSTVHVSCTRLAQGNLKRIGQIGHLLVKVGYIVISSTVNNKRTGRIAFSAHFKGKLVIAYPNAFLQQCRQEFDMKGGIPGSNVGKCLRVRLVRLKG